MEQLQLINNIRCNLNIIRISRENCKNAKQSCIINILWQKVILCIIIINYKHVDRSSTPNNQTICINNGNDKMQNLGLNLLVLTYLDFKSIGISIQKFSECLGFSETCARKQIWKSKGLEDRLTIIHDNIQPELTSSTLDFKSNITVEF
ncbi:Hypothetical_protein [Hexamita inflata]|uniref:Hypothetical_protein n=1 Tax=Hexamita inflata TaxID=28002 RepID=A0AA86QLQ3_9EUKA|nr:Hypothetical protein HINF_LOCUS43777 [Hexamita inflata]